MKFISISDTHSRHGFIPDEWLESADVIIHAGDISMRGYKDEVENFLTWYSSLPYKYKILIAGNHDWLFQDCPTMCKDLLSKHPDIIYLQDSGCEIEGIKIWGSPVQPTFYNWAFNKDRGPHIKFYWDLIPDKIDILITHGPVYGYVDMLEGGERVGCEDLKEKVDLIKPKVHICGHIHSAYGVESNEHTKFINASIADEKYKMSNKPIIFEI